MLGNLIKKIFQEHYQCQMVWIQIRTDVCKGYQQMTEVTASMERVKQACAAYLVGLDFLFKAYIYQYFVYMIGLTKVW